MRLAERIRHVELSPTFRINAMARRMKAQGIDVLDFSVGEPDFETPRCAKKAGKSAIDRNVTRYTANEGTLELRRAIVDKLKADNSLTYATDQILVSPGAKASLYCAAMALFGPATKSSCLSPTGSPTRSRSALRARPLSHWLRKNETVSRSQPESSRRREARTPAA